MDLRDTMKFPEQLYVGCKGNFDTSKYPLGFATPFGTDKAFEKRKSTVDSWSGKNGTFKTFKNDPLPGFMFDKAVSRYSTSNKMFQINDPRGFTLEIDAYNLGDLLSNATISCGNLEGEFVWGRSKGNNFLTRLDHPDYIEYFTTRNKPKERFAPKVGEVINLSTASNVLYLGKFYAAEITQHTKEDQRRSYYSYGSINNSPPEYYYTLSVNNELRHAFVKVDSQYHFKHIKFLKSMPAKGEKSDLEFDMNDFDKTKFTRSYDSYRVAAKLFDTKQDADKLRSELDLEAEYLSTEKK